MVDIVAASRVVSALSGAGLLVLAVRPATGDRNAAESSFALLVGVLVAIFALGTLSDRLFDAE